MVRFRRFARVFEFDPDHIGTGAQRSAMIETLSYETDSDWDHLNLRLAQEVKKLNRIITIGFHPDMLTPATSGPAGINFNDHIDVSGIQWYAPHEVGHLIEYYLLSDEGKKWFMAATGRTHWGMETQEIFADAMRDWRRGSWQGLNQFLLPGGE